MIFIEFILLHRHSFIDGINKIGKEIPMEKQIVQSSTIAPPPPPLFFQIKKDKEFFK